MTHSTLTAFRLPRAGKVDLSFDGIKLSEVSSDEDGKDFWSEIRIYRTASNRYVVEEVGRSRFGHPDKPTAVVVDSGADVAGALTRISKRTGLPFLTNLALDALADAADIDPAIVTTESI